MLGSIKPPSHPLEEIHQKRSANLVRSEDKESLPNGVASLMKSQGEVADEKRQNFKPKQNTRESFPTQGFPNPP
jgi:hypothetical protein